MAVFTEVPAEAAEKLLRDLHLGELRELRGIQGGIEKAEAAQALEPAEQPLQLSLDAQGRLLWNQDVLNLAQLRERLLQQRLVDAAEVLRIATRRLADPTADPDRDVAGAPLVLVVHPSLPVKTLTEFIAFAKAHPGEVHYGSSGNGSTPHLATAAAAQRGRCRYRRRWRWYLPRSPPRC